MEFWLLQLVLIFKATCTMRSYWGCLGMAIFITHLNHAGPGSEGCPDFQHMHKENSPWYGHTHRPSGSWVCHVPATGRLPCCGSGGCAAAALRGCWSSLPPRNSSSSCCSHHPCTVFLNMDTAFATQNNVFATNCPWWITKCSQNALNWFWLHRVPTARISLNSVSVNQENTTSLPAVLWRPGMTIGVSQEMMSARECWQTMQAADSAITGILGPGYAWWQVST